MECQTQKQGSTKWLAYGSRDWIIKDLIHKKTFWKEIHRIEINKTIIAKNEQKTKPATVKDLLTKMVETIDCDNIVLQVTLQQELKDPLTKYRSKDGILDTTKIPQAIWLVSILYELNKVAELNGWAMGRQYDYLYLYNGKVWLQADKSHLMEFMKNATLKMNFEFPTEARTARFKKNAFEEFLSSAKFFAGFEDRKDILINFQNGTLEIGNGKHLFREHRKEDFLTNILPFEYDQKAKALIFMQYLNEVLPDQESQYLLQEFCGYIFTRHLKLEKALVLFGSGANGKSVFFEVLTSLIGRENYCTYSLGDLTDMDSGNANRAGLKDKLVNYGSEIRGDKLDTDIFKRLVSGEPVSARLKYGNPFDLTSNTKMIFNANTFPKNVEHNEAFFRRFIIIPFGQTIPEEKRDPQLHTKIAEKELQGVFNWVIEGLDRLVKQLRFSECLKAKEALSGYKFESDTVASFVSDGGYTPSNAALTKGTDMFREYKSYCNEDNFRPVSTKNFYERLRALGFKTERLTDNKMFVYCANGWV
jgi:putative DNA primase/helicase